MPDRLNIQFTGAAAGDQRTQRPDFPTVEPGGSVTLSWTVTGAESLRLLWDDGSGEHEIAAGLAAQGTRTIESVTAEGRWRLEAKAGGAVESREVRVHLAGLHESSPVVAVTSPGGLDALPLLLCGPMLRLVSPPGEDGKSTVSVFFAAKEPLSAQLAIAGAVEPPAAVATVPLGPYLHVALVTGSFQLEAGKLHQYDLALSGGRTLQTPGVVQSGDLGKALSHEAGGLPAFLAPPETLEELRVMQGSCRKTGGGSVDALALADVLLADEARRPHQLLLTGDQIYADEVPVSMLTLLRDRAALLLGAADQALGETLPPHGQTVAALAFAAAGPDLDRGTRVVSKLPGWSDKKVNDGHLLFLHEFFAMYLMVFSPALWTDESLPPALARLIDDADKPAAVPLDDALRRATRDRKRKQVKRFRDALFAVRRLLANVPSLMICDDHEVTDDWNIDSFWVRDLLASPLEARIVRNALAAYAVFQDWGNRPALYEEGGKARPILEALKLGGAEGAWQPPAWLAETGASELDRLLLPKGAANGGELSFDYTLSYPSHRLVVLDTRTRRKFPDAADKKWLPQLISAEALDQQLPPPDGDRLDLVVSATPVFGEPAIENVLALYRRKHDSRDTDQEDWACSRIAQHEVAVRLGRNRRTVVLSGDVHYSFSLSVDATLQTDAGEKKARFVQLCCSSLRNEDLTSHFSAAANAPVVNRLPDAAVVAAPGSAQPSAEDRAFDETLKLERNTAFGLIERVEPSTLQRNGAALPFPGIVVPYNNVGLITFATASGLTRVKHQLFWPVPRRERHFFESDDAAIDSSLELPMFLLFLSGFKVAVTTHELEVNRRDDAHFDGTEQPPKKVKLSVPMQAGLADRLWLRRGNVNRKVESDDATRNGDMLVFEFDDVPVGHYALLAGVGDDPLQTVVADFEVSEDGGESGGGEGPPCEEPPDEPAEPAPDADEEFDFSFFSRGG